MNIVRALPTDQLEGHEHVKVNPCRTGCDSTEERVAYDADVLGDARDNSSNRDDTSRPNVMGHSLEVLLHEMPNVRLELRPIILAQHAIKKDKLISIHDK